MTECSIKEVARLTMLLHRAEKNSMDYCLLLFNLGRSFDRLSPKLEDYVIVSKQEKEKTTLTTLINQVEKNLKNNHISLMNVSITGYNDKQEPIMKPELLYASKVGFEQEKD